MNARDTVFYLGIGTLFTHELDAMPNHEWRGIPLLRALPDETGMMVFVALHVPIFAALIGLVASSSSRVRTLTMVGVSSFLILHGGLHWLSTGQPHYEFSGVLSDLLVYGGALLGAVHLGLIGTSAK